MMEDMKRRRSPDDGVVYRNLDPNSMTTRNFDN